ncbi:MAG: hypothetical protein PHS30_08965 [Bacteroidales bacterium]|nr:hypothetical protein [Bacteroidales bacterium]
MKNLNVVAFFTFILLFISCSTASKFPVSSVTPAANIVVYRHHDSNGNRTITIKAKNLASTERLSPPKQMYVVWILVENNMAKNIGQLKIKNAKEAEIKTLTAFNYTEIFITAEDQADVQYPSNLEISRIKF